MELNNLIKIFLIALIYSIIFCINDKKELFTDHISTLEKFDIHILFFNSNNSSESKKIKPIWQKIKQNLNNHSVNAYKIKMFEIDVDKKPLLTYKYNVKKYPSIYFSYYNKDIKKKYEYNDTISYLSFIKSINSIYKSILTQRTIELFNVQ